MRPIVRVRPLPGGNYFLDAKAQTDTEFTALKRVIQGGEDGPHTVWESEIGVATASELAFLLLVLRTSPFLCIQWG